MTLVALKHKWESLPQDMRTWLLGLFAALEGGIVASFTQFYFAGTPLCFTFVCLKTYGIAILTGAFIAVRMYLKKSPIQPVLKAAWDGMDRRGEARAAGGQA